MKDLHIDWGETTVSDGAADSTSEGESGVKVGTGELLRSVGKGLLDDGVDLGRAGGWVWSRHGDGS